MRVTPSVAYCMNLDSRPDRWRQVTSDFQRLSQVLPISIERVSAVDEPSRPARGVAQTVHKIITMAKENELPYVLIAEDDLYVIDGEKVKACLHNAPEDWDLLSGGVYYYQPTGVWDENWVRVKDFCSLHFIIVRASIYDKVLQMTGASTHIDRMLGEKVKRGQMTMYLMHPMPCQQRAGYSNIRKRMVNDNKKNLPWIQSPSTLKSTT